MGISAAVGIPSALLLAAAGCCMLFMDALRAAAPPAVVALAVAVMAQSGVAGLLVAAFSHPLINRPRAILHKSASGQLSWCSYAIFYPYLIATRLYLFFKRSSYSITNSSSSRRSRSNNTRDAAAAGCDEAHFTEICDGLFVGGWPQTAEQLPPGKPAVVDCTIELPRSSCVSEDHPYLCIPAWDTRSPSAEDIELAVRWAVKQRARNHPILIHCAKGHGRSVAVMSALLVALGVVEDWKEGELLVKRHRPRIRLNAAQKASLQEWQRRYHRQA